MQRRYRIGAEVQLIVAMRVAETGRPAPVGMHPRIGREKWSSLSLVGRASEALQHLLRVAGDIYFRIDLEDPAIGTDEVTDPFGTRCFGTLAGSIEQANFARRVAEQREVEIVFLREGTIVFLVIDADAEDLGVLLLEEPELVAEPATFDGSAGSVGLGVEPEDDVSPPIVGEPDVVSQVIGDFEIRSGLTFLEHRDLSLPPSSRANRTIRSLDDRLSERLDAGQGALDVLHRVVDVRTEPQSTRGRAGDAVLEVETVHHVVTFFVRHFDDANAA